MSNLKYFSILLTGLVTINAHADGVAQAVDNLEQVTSSLESAVNSNSAAISTNTQNISENTSAINTVAAQVAAIPVPVSYDYKNFSNQASSKTFLLQGYFSTCNEAETWTPTRTIVGDVTHLEVNITRTKGGSVCRNWTFNYELTSDAKKLVSRDNNDLAGTTLSTDLLSKPFTVAKSSMVEGKSFGGATGLTNAVQYPGQISVFANTVTVEGNQEVSVPAGTFTGCLKIHTVRNSGDLGNFNRYSWHCPGLGEVKRIQIDPANLQARFWKLYSYTL